MTNSRSKDFGRFFLGKCFGRLDFLHCFGACCLSLLFLVQPACSEVAPNTLPTGYNAPSGNVSFNQLGNTLNVNSSSNKSIVNYQSFSVGSQSSVNFNLPNASSVILNRVTGGLTSEIYGNINSNGHVFLVNPNGILFGSGSQVNVGSLTASTLNIQDDDFLKGNYSFSRTNSTSIINQGNINASTSVNLFASAILNEGNIKVNDVNLAVGEKIQLNIDNNISSEVVVTEALKEKVTEINDAIKNTGNISGNHIKLESQLTNTFYESLVNNEGIIQANLLVSHNGEIELLGYSNDKKGVVVNSGKIEGENIKVIGDKTGLMSGSEIDGNQILIGGDYQGNNPEIINSQVAYVDKDAKITANGDEKKVIVWADDTTRFYGEIKANEGFVKVSGKNYLDFGGKVIAENLLLDPTNLEIVAGTTGVNVTAVSPFQPVAAGTTSQIGVNNITTALNSANVTISTIGSPDTAGHNGDISLIAPLTFTGGTARTLTLNAAGDININNLITSSVVLRGKANFFKFDKFSLNKFIKSISFNGYNV